MMRARVRWRVDIRKLREDIVPLHLSRDWLTVAAMAKDSFHFLFICVSALPT
jgi:hypothetical protein